MLNLAPLVSFSPVKLQFKQHQFNMEKKKKFGTEPRRLSRAPPRCLFFSFFLPFSSPDANTQRERTRCKKNHDTLPEGEYKFAPFLSFSFCFSPGDDAQSRTAIPHAVLAAAEARFTGEECKRRTCHSLIGERCFFFFVFYVFFFPSSPSHAQALVRKI